MGKVTGFSSWPALRGCAAGRGAIRSYREFILTLKDGEAAAQGARCMDCGIPFCQSGYAHQQHHSGLGTICLSPSVASGARCAAFDQ